MYDVRSSSSPFTRATQKFMMSSARQPRLLHSCAQLRGTVPDEPSGGIVGFFVGDADGVAVGLPVVGVDVGSAVGVDVEGSAVGIGVGAAVGVCVVG